MLDEVMMEHLLNNDENVTTKLEPIFKKIVEGNTILFLGAGASVSDEKQFFSKHIMNYYEDSIHKKLGLDDITEFVDLLSANSQFDRKDFDTFVYQLIKKLDPTKTHEIIASIPWRQIITTNFDLLIEKAYDNIRNTANRCYDLVTIKNQKEMQRIVRRDQVKYIKLNGCASDRKAYNFIFSSDDFQRVRPFYRSVLSELSNVSDEILFLSVGYSYSDYFSKKLLELFDKEDFRRRRWFHTVDPFIDESRLDFLKSNKIRVIKLSIRDFFSHFNSWRESNAETIVKSKGYSYYNINNQKISIPPQLSLSIGDSIQQLHDNYRSKYISAGSFYKGEEPDYSVILRGYDVVRVKLLKEVSSEIEQFVNQLNSQLVPIIFLTGSFGTGKSTFTYRFINYQLRQTVRNTIAFEINDPFHLDINSLTDFIDFFDNMNFIFYYNLVERDSVFKQLLEFRNKISTQQINKRIIIICSIRENLLERFKYERDITCVKEIKIDFELTEEEIGELVIRLKNENILAFRDEKEKRKIIIKIAKEYKGDSYITLLELVEGKHFLDLIETYERLPQIAQQSLIFVSLLHQFNIFMPIGLLRELVADDWDHFRKEILVVDCKGILIQEQNNISGSYPDLFYRTKHPIIAQKIVTNIIPNADDQFKHFEKIIAKISQNEANSRLVIDLFKAMKTSNNFTDIQINRLFDLAINKLSDDPYFLLNYTMNLIHRYDLKSLEKSLKLIIYAEGLFPFRNHKFIHRRAVINFEIAKYHYLQNSSMIIINNYLKESKDLFELKLIMDPCSSYSYVKYIECLMWILDRLKLSDSDYLRYKIQLEELFDQADRSVFQDVNKIMDLHKKYAVSFLYQNNEVEYLELLNKYYDNTQTKPLALILYHNFYIYKGEFQKADMCFCDLEKYDYIQEVSKFLFKYYGRNLHVVNYRKKFFELVDGNKSFEKSESLRYNYYMYVANAYNQYFNEAKKYILNINTRYDYINPDYQIPWKDNSGTIEIFEGFILKNNKNYNYFNSSTFQKKFRLTRINNNLLPGQKVKAKLFFYLNGIRAEIIE